MSKFLLNGDLPWSFWQLVRAAEKALTYLHGLPDFSTIYCRWLRWKTDIATHSFSLRNTVKFLGENWFLPKRKRSVRFNLFAVFCSAISALLYFFASITSFSYFLECQNPQFFSISNSLLSNLCSQISGLGNSAKTRYQPIFRHFLGAVLQYLAIFYEN